MLVPSYFNFNFITLVPFHFNFNFFLKWEQPVVVPIPLYLGNKRRCGKLHRNAIVFQSINQNLKEY